MMLDAPSLIGSFPAFKTEWWAYRMTYYGLVGDKLIAKVMKEKCVSMENKIIIGSREVSGKYGRH
jgi:hypothetical protein